MPIYNAIGEYSQQELDLIIKTCLELHYKYGYGIVLNRKVHSLYHLQYGKLDGDIEEFKAFVNINYGIDFQYNQTAIISNNIKDDICFPFKENKTSKYYGISYMKKDKCWTYQTTVNKVHHRKQGYKDELECVYDLNQIILSVKGSSATTNYLTDEQNEYVKKLKLEKAS